MIFKQVYSRLEQPYMLMDFLKLVVFDSVIHIITIFS